MRRASMLATMCLVLAIALPAGADEATAEVSTVYSVRLGAGLLQPHDCGGYCDENVLAPSLELSVGRRVHPRLAVTFDAKLHYARPEAQHTMMAAIARVGVGARLSVQLGSGIGIQEHLNGDGGPGAGVGWAYVAGLELALTQGIRAYVNFDFIRSTYGTAMGTTVGVAFGRW